MAEIFEADFNDQKILERLQNLENQILKLGKDIDTVGDTAAQSLNQAAGAAGKFDAAMDNAATDVSKSVEKLKKDFLEANSTLNGTVKTLEGVGKTAGGLAKPIYGTATSVKKLSDDIVVNGKTVGDWKKQLEASGRALSKLGDSGSGAAKGIGLGKIAMSAFGATLKATGIGLVISLVVGLIGAFKNLQPVIDLTSRVMSSISAVVGVLAERVYLLGIAAVKVFRGDFSGAATDAAAAVTGVGAALVNAATDAYELETAFQSLRDTIMRNSVLNAQQERDLAKINGALGNVNLTIKEKMSLEKQAGDLRRQIAERDLKAAEENLKLSQRGADAAELDGVKQQEAREAQIAFLSAQSKLIEVQSEAENKQRELRKEAADERRKQLEEYEKLFADIQKQSKSLAIENTFNPVERVVKQYQQAITETEALRARLLTIAPGDAERAKVNEAIETLFDELAIKYREELNAAEDELNELKGGKLREALNPLPPPETITEDLKFRAKTTLAVLSDAADQFIEAQQPRSLLDILGISEESFDELKDATKKALGFLNELADGRVKEADAAVQAAERKVQAAEEALEKEQNLAAEGLANDTSIREQQLAAAKAAQDQAEKERAKAVRTQILLDSAQQVSSLITATANIFKGFSSLPIVGQILAVASIGAMFAAFAAAKTQALKAAQVPKFRKGTRLEGRSHEAGGLAITDEHGNLVGEAEGEEWLIGTQPSREHDTFLYRLNRGEFAGVDLNQYIPKQGAAGVRVLSDSAKSVERVERERRTMETANHSALLASVYKQAAGEIVTAIREQPEIYPLSGYKVRRRKGRTTDVTIVRQEN